MINPQLSYRIEQEIQNNYKSTAQSQMQDAGLLLKKFMVAYINNPAAIQKCIDENFKPRT